VPASGRTRPLAPSWDRNGPVKKSLSAPPRRLACAQRARGNSAAGSTDYETTLVLHWNGTSWS